MFVHNVFFLYCVVHRLMSSLVFTLKSDAPEAREQIEQACAAQAQQTEGKMTYAWCVEDPKTILILYSWDSIQVGSPFVSSD